MFSFFKKVTCHNCKKDYLKSRTINYAGFIICSNKCMYEFFEGITLAELRELDIRDRLINQDFYAWLYKTKSRVKK